jgi:Domain of unknown function DUF29
MADPVAKERPAQKKRARYEDDYYTWVNEQVALLRERRFDELDAENVAEELSDLAKDEFAKLESCLRVLLMHMLKWDQQPEHRTRSWVFSIREQWPRYTRLIKQNPGLKPRIGEGRDQAYEDARDWAANETHLSPRDFPKACPYDWKDILERPSSSTR